MATSRYTVIYETEAGERHKLCKVFLSGDGSYGITVPYHPSEQVSLIKRLINYPNRDVRLAREPLEMAVLEDDEHRLKLSHHPDGFVQFSGSGIRSGRNPDGSAKGLGIRSFPLGQPTAGPAYGVTIFRPEQFAKADAPRKGDLLFTEAALHRTKRDTGLLVEVYALPARWRRFIRMREGVPVIWIDHPSGATLELTVCTGPGEDWQHGFVGVDVWSMPLGDQPSGFILASPSGGLHYNADEELEGEALYAIYPPTVSIAGGTPIEMAFPPRNDPAYHRGGVPPSGHTVLPQGTPPRGPADPEGGEEDDEPEPDAPSPAPDSAAETHNRANRLRDEGDVEGARRAFEEAIEADHPEVSPRSAYNLGHMLEESDPAAAEKAYRKAIEYDDPHNAARAGVNLGRLLFAQGEIEAAKAALIRAAAYEDFEQRPKALINLATARRAEGMKGAAEALEAASATAHPDLALTAAELLGDLNSENGRREAASEAYVRTVQMQHPFHSSRAAIKLGRLAEDEGDLEAAEDAYRIAMGGSHPRLAAEAGYYVGSLRLQAGDVEGAREPFELAATSESEQVAEAGRARLAHLDSSRAGEADAGRSEGNLGRLSRDGKARK